MPSDCYLAFDDERGFGSREHFHHFLWGYLLPGIDLAVEAEGNAAASSPTRKYMTRTCGPLMDRVASEMFALHGLDHDVLHDADLEQWTGSVLEVPRWDVDMKVLAYRHIGRTSHGLTRRLKSTLMTHLDRATQRFVARARRVRSRTLEHLARSGVDPATSRYAGRYLLLKRSPPVDFYRESGPAEVAQYGTSRRSLLGVEEAADTLEQQGFPVSVVEPGSLDLKTQIQAFHACAGVIGVRGAEFANLAWARPRTLVVVLCPASMTSPTPVRGLVQPMRLEYIEIDSAEDHSPTLDPAAIRRWLKKQPTQA